MMDDSRPMVSVIIPTYNRRASLLRALDSMAVQTLPFDQFEVIVVDDGSSDDTRSIAQKQFPYTCRYIRQENQGATKARNHGAAMSKGEILVFIDDDVTVSPQTLEALADACCQQGMSLVMGTIIGRNNGSSSVYTSIVLGRPHLPEAKNELVKIHFTNCNTELLACKRSDFFALGMMEDPTHGHGWPNWDDVDFAYRANLQGFHLLQSQRAVGEHWDYSVSDRSIACQRWFRAGRSAVWLFTKHEGLQGHIPMLADKTPLAWGKDSPKLMARKVARRLISSPPMLGALEKFTTLLEQRYPSPKVLGRLYYWVQGAYMLHGYRKGLREFERSRGKK